MTHARPRKGEDEQSRIQGSINKNVIVKKPPKSLRGPRKNKSGEKDVSTVERIASHLAKFNSDNASDLASRMHININHGDQEMHLPSLKIKLQLFPLDENIRTALEKDGHNPYLELTLSARKRISSVVTHLISKWGSSSIATGELMLFPFNVVAENFTSCRRWSSSDCDVRAGDVHSAVGSPEIFRLRYGWVSPQPYSSTFHLGSSHLENIHIKEAACGSEYQVERKSKDLELCNMNRSTNEPVKQTVSSEPPIPVVHVDQATAKGEIVKPRKTVGTENATAVEENFSAKPVTHEEEKWDRNLSQASVTPLFWADLSNMSVGGLFSEASLQGLFNTTVMKSGNSRSTSLPSASAADSMDAFINHLNSFRSSASHPPDMPSSILDAEDTCHSFAFSKPSGKDSRTLGRGAFSGLSNQDTAFRPYKCSKSEANMQNDAKESNAVQEPVAEPMPCSAGVYNNENSLGLSSIRWNDSLGPFDLPLVPRQIIKDDSISIGRFVR